MSQYAAPRSCVIVRHRIGQLAITPGTRCR